MLERLRSQQHGPSPYLFCFDELMLLEKVTETGAFTVGRLVLKS